MINIVFNGRVGKEPRKVGKGVVATIAVDDFHPVSGSTEWTQDTYWIDCWFGEKALTKLTKGDTVFITGKASFETVPVQEGEYVHNKPALKSVFVSDFSVQKKHASNSEPSNKALQTDPEKLPSFEDEVDDDDIVF